MLPPAPSTGGFGEAGFPLLQARGSPLSHQREELALGTRGHRGSLAVTEPKKNTEFPSTNEREEKSCVSAHVLGYIFKACDLSEHVLSVSGRGQASGNFVAVTRDCTATRPIPRQPCAILDNMFPRALKSKKNWVNLKL